MNKVIIFKTSESASQWIAKQFIDQVKTKPSSVLGFATGVTPLRFYDLLRIDHKENNTDWSNVIAFNLDEFIGVPKEHPESFRSQMNNNLFNGLNIKSENINLPDGLCSNPEKEADNYENLIDSKGGIELQFISLGANGHMAYNEPGTSLSTKSHVAQLADFTKKVLVEQGKFSSIEEAPSSAITVGVQTIMNFKKIIMTSFGAAKAEMAKRMMEGEVSSAIPSSALQNHKNVIYILDEESAKKLDLTKFNVERKD